VPALVHASAGASLALRHPAAFLPHSRGNADCIDLGTSAITTAVDIATGFAQGQSPLRKSVSSSIHLPSIKPSKLSCSRTVPASQSREPLSARARSQQAARGQCYLSQRMASAHAACQARMTRHPHHMVANPGKDAIVVTTTRSTRTATFQDRACPAQKLRARTAHAVTMVVQMPNRLHSHLRMTALLARLRRVCWTWSRFHPTCRRESMSLAGAYSLCLLNFAYT